MKFFALVLSLNLISLSSVWAANYNYNKLRFTKYEKLRLIKVTALKTSRKYDYQKYPLQSQKPLKEALKMFYSRPNSDNSIRKLTPEIEAELRTMGLFEKTLRGVIEDCRKTYESERFDKETRATGVLCVNNVLIELKPKILKETNLAHIVCETADKNLKVPKLIKNDIQLTSGLLRQSPSKTAQKIMHWYASQKGKKVNAQAKGCPFSKRAT